jgi:hypothetical protein
MIYTKDLLFFNKPFLTGISLSSVYEQILGFKDPSSYFAFYFI